MKISRKSMISGKVHEMDLNVTEAQMADYAAARGYIQDIFSNLSADEREFIKTGITAAEWNAVFDKADEADDEEY